MVTGTGVVSHPALRKSKTPLLKSLAQDRPCRDPGTSLHHPIAVLLCLLTPQGTKVLLSAVITDSHCYGLSHSPLPFELVLDKWRMFLYLM